MCFVCSTDVVLWHRVFVVVVIVFAAAAAAAAAVFVVVGSNQLHFGVALFPLSECQWLGGDAPK